MLLITLPFTVMLVLHACLATLLCLRLLDLLGVLILLPLLRLMLIHGEVKI